MRADNEIGQHDELLLTIGPTCHLEQGGCVVEGALGEAHLQLHVPGRVVVPAPLDVGRVEDGEREGVNLNDFRQVDILN